MDSNLPLKRLHIRIIELGVVFGQFREGLQHALEHKDKAIALVSAARSVRPGPWRRPSTKYSCIIEDKATITTSARRESEMRATVSPPWVLRVYPDPCQSALAIRLCVATFVYG